MASNWKRYLEQETGVHGYEWLINPAYLLLDEAQESYWDGELWAAFFKDIEQNNPKSPFVVLFASYGSPGRGNAGFNQEVYIKTPMDFHAPQMISVRPDESVLDFWDPVGLLLEEDEATDIMNRYEPTAGYPFLSSELQRHLFLITGGHAGALTSLLGLLPKVPVSVLHNLQFGNIVHED